MGLNTKQIPSDPGVEWGQTSLQAGIMELPKHSTPLKHQQQQRQEKSQEKPEPLKCPRCVSTNTKFCYYNNYNKSQPRHFCKACKRHWTEGGTLRNVPVGGGRKNKRLKTSNDPATSSNNTTMTTTPPTTTNTKSQENSFDLPFFGSEKHISDILYQALIHPSSSLQNDHMISNFSEKYLMGCSNGSLTESVLSSSHHQQQQIPFPLASIGCFEGIPSSISPSFQSSDVNDYMGKLELFEDSTVTTEIPLASSNSAICDRPWEGPATSRGMDMPSYWNWNDINSLASADLNISWDDDIEIKPQ